MTEYTYDAHLAGLSEGFENGKYGLKLSVGGFGEKQRQFISELVGKMADFVPDERRFDVLKERFVRSLKNFRQDQPYSQALYYTSLILTDHIWSKEQLLAATKGDSMKTH